MVKLKDWKIITGLVLITLVLVALGFALGVHVGKNGTLEVKVDQLKNLNRQSVQVQGTEKEQPNILGRLVNKNEDMLIVSTRQGVRQIMVTQETVFRDEEQQSLSFTDLQPGDNLAIFGNLIGERQTTFTARTVIRITELP